MALSEEHEARHNLSAWPPLEECSQDKLGRRRPRILALSSLKETWVEMSKIKEQINNKNNKVLIK